MFTYSAVQEFVLCDRREWLLVCRKSTSK